MSFIGFKEAKRKVIAALKNGAYQHEARDNIDTKNLLQMGSVSAAQVCDLLRVCQGQDHSSSPHHQAPDIQVHVVRRDGWYIKFYFVDPDTVFISVHQ